MTVATGTVTQLAVVWCLSDDDDRPPINDQLYLLPVRLATVASLSPTSSAPAQKNVYCRPYLISRIRIPIRESSFDVDLLAKPEVLLFGSKMASVVVLITDLHIYMHSYNNDVTSDYTRTNPDHSNSICQ